MTCNQSLSSTATQGVQGYVVITGRCVELESEGLGTPALQQLCVDLSICVTLEPPTVKWVESQS